MQTLSVDQFAGQILGSYRVERLLGRGRLNAVYLGKNRSGERTVAITLYILPERFSPNARSRFLQRFHSEAASLTTLQHPHILPVYEYGEHAGYPYLITPYMMSGSLADIQKREGRFSHERILEILEQVVAGLEYAHNKGIVHGTLKPSNIVLNAEQSMQVAGFGLMHMLQLQGIEQSNQPYAHLLSVANTYLVAPEYIAPEIVQGQSIDKRSDVYALGAILFELLGGKPPFTGPDPLTIARMHVEQLVPSLRALCPDLPIALESVVNQSLERDPARRFQHASELAEAFTQVSRGATGAFPNITRGANPSSQRQNTSSETPRDGYATSNWQFTPPIVTGKFPSVAPAAQEKKSGVAAPAALGPSQFYPPIMTGHMPTLKSSPRPVPEPVFEEVPTQSKRLQGNSQQVRPAVSRQTSAPIPTVAPQQRATDTERADEWWRVPDLALQNVQEPMRLQQSEASSWGSEALAYPQSTKLKNSRQSKQRARGLKRRQVLALLATGGVAAAGVVLAVNTPLLHSVSNMLHPQSAAQANTGTMPPANKPTQGKTPQKAVSTGNTANTNKKAQNGTAANAGHTGTSIGTSKQAANSSQAFVNPADQKASLLLHLPDGNFTAYERACTHVGVLVNYDPATHLLMCPAHGAIFDPTSGAVVQGPATRPLPKVAIHVNADGTITAA